MRDLQLTLLMFTVFFLCTIFVHQEKSAREAWLFVKSTIFDCYLKVFPGFSVNVREGFLCQTGGVLDIFKVPFLKGNVRDCLAKLHNYQCHFVSLESLVSNREACSKLFLSYLKHSSA